MKKPPQTIKSKTLYQGRVLDVIQETIRYGNDNEKIFDLISHPGAVVVLPQLNNGNFLLIKQYRHAVKKFIYEIPAGTLEKGEEPLECAEREIVEETGYQAAKWHSLGTQYPTPGFCDELQYCFLARELTPKTGQMDEDEIIETVEFDAKQLRELVLKSSLCDGKSLACILKAWVAKLIEL